jgi:hypothetical protein
MVVFQAALFNTVNILLCIGMLIYSLKFYQLFRGGMMQRALSVLVISVLFFLLAALARASLIWGILPPDTPYVDIALRTVAFVFLFIALMRIVHDWTKLGK